MAIVATAVIVVTAATVVSVVNVRLVPSSNSLAIRVKALKVSNNSSNKPYEETGCW